MKLIGYQIAVVLAIVISGARVAGQGPREANTRLKSILTLPKGVRFTKVTARFEGSSLNEHRRKVVTLSIERASEIEALRRAFVESTHDPHGWEPGGESSPDDVILFHRSDGKDIIVGIPPWRVNWCLGREVAKLYGRYWSKAFHKPYKSD